MSKWAALLFVLVASVIACGPFGNSVAVIPTPTPCPGPVRHDFGDSVAKTYEVPYEQVMKWFCDGYEFTDILLALQTSKETPYTVDELLQMTKTATWEEIWKQTGFLK